MMKSLILLLVVIATAAYFVAPASAVDVRVCVAGPSGKLIPVNDGTEIAYDRGSAVLCIDIASP